ncbi:Arylsulfatase [Limihaloglobus sulfuriphilus]|uniref:Arylsulfatase n=1 Tax=Limihaloglobus sulfuriphilus TaxID=1851148 RepID=A0A1Q2MFM5_9BACT|nr:sulfatase [Limihaloglobus sulfuriphilus]AQQ71470.1 Arylsulfatase [Limihaloglobus sulfuriphilus]
MKTVHMTRRSFLGSIGLLTSATAFEGCLNFSRSDRLDRVNHDKPNIVLIMADDLGYGDIGCYGNKKIRTPNLDAMAKRGMKFTDYHSNGAVCSPTRASLLTGRYQQRTGIDICVSPWGTPPYQGLPLGETTFAELLKDNGYKTALFGKWHLGIPDDLNPTKQGFDEFKGYLSGNIDYISHIDQEGNEDWRHNGSKVVREGYSTDLITEDTVSFIKENADKPFCVLVSHEAPHYPLQIRSSKAQRTKGKPPEHTAEINTDQIYKEMIEIMDEGIGRINTVLEKLGLAKNTFVFFCSDNGAASWISGSNGPLRGCKSRLSEGGHRVPAIACWQGKIKADVTSDETSMSMDLFPTLLKLANLQLPDEIKIDGVNLLPLLLENKPLGRRTLFWSYRGQKAVRKGDWKLLVQGSKVQLYNLKSDLEEQHNLASKNPELVRELEMEFAQWEKDFHERNKWRPEDLRPYPK